MKQTATGEARQRLLSVLLLLAVVVWSPLAASCQSRELSEEARQSFSAAMDALGIGPGSVVADVGAGPGPYTFPLAERVGPDGKVYAVDIDEDDLAKIRSRAEREDVVQVETILGATDDPRLPAAALDVVLVINAYHEFREYDEMLQGFHRALKPGGRLAIIDAKTGAGEARSRYHSRHRIPAELVREDTRRNGFRLLHNQPRFVHHRRNREFYLLVFEKPVS